MTPVAIHPGAMTLHHWRAIYRRAPASLDPACRPAVEAAAGTIAAIVAKGEPVYGINTGFGRLANVRIDAADLAQLSATSSCPHARGVGEPLPDAVVRLVMALKIANLGQGASGSASRRWNSWSPSWSAIFSLDPAQGSVGASGDLAPLAHLACALIGVGEILVAGQRRPGSRGVGGGRGSSP
jgi:histidine ammonia-lyase